MFESREIPEITDKLFEKGDRVTVHVLVESQLDSCGQELRDFRIVGVYANLTQAKQEEKRLTALFDLKEEEGEYDSTLNYEVISQDLVE